MTGWGSDPYAALLLTVALKTCPQAPSPQMTMATIIALAKRLRRRLQHALNFTDDEYRGTLGALKITFVLVVATALFLVLEHILAYVS